MKAPVLSKTAAIARSSSLGHAALRVPEISSVDQVMAEERAASFAKRSIKSSAKLAGLKLVTSMMDLTTLEGKDTPGKVAYLCRKALQPAEAKYQVPPCAAVCVYPNMVRYARRFLGDNSAVNIASVATDNPPPDQTKYVLAKSALVGLTRSLAVEFAARNIQVNMVVPSFVETDLVAHVPEGFRTKLAEQTPMGRHATPADVAHAVLFLASSFSSFTTGQKILVTGGGAPYL